MKKYILSILIIFVYQILFCQISIIKNKSLPSVGINLNNGFTYWYLKNYNYKKVDSLVKLCPKDISYDSKKICDYLKSISNNEHENVRAVYMWIILNITYDHTMRLLDSIMTYNREENVLTYTYDTVRAILQIKKVICGYYSILFNDMCSKLNIESMEKDGYVKTNNSYGYHAWNVVKIYNEYFIIDTTWGVDNDKYQNEFYYLANPHKIIYTHFPDDDNFQLLNKKITKSQFYRNPKITSFDFQKIESISKNK